MKQLLAFIALLGSIAITLANGEVYISGGISDYTKISTNSGGPTGYISGPVGTWQFALFSAPTDVFSVNPVPWVDPNWAFTGVYSTNTALPGRYLGYTPGNPNFAAEIPGYDAGSYVHLMVIGWDTATGGFDLYSVISAYNNGTLGFYGQSAIGNILLGNGADLIDSSLFGPNAGQIPGFILTPEPSSLTLLGLGAAALVWCQRRTSRKAEA